MFIRDRDIKEGSVWSYKERLYEVILVDNRSLIQDPETGNWRPKILYKTKDTPNITFNRSDTEWLRKFQHIRD